jgi:hypothetical protein
MYIHIYIYIYIHKYVYINMYIYISTSSDGGAHSSWIAPGKGGE